MLLLFKIFLFDKMAVPGLRVKVAEKTLSCYEDFVTTVYPDRHPCVLHGVDVGVATAKWTPDYLAERCGDKEVRVHVSPDSSMDFINKNFSYKTLPFNELIRRSSKARHSQYFIDPEEKYYLRSLGGDPRKDVANFASQYPELSDDLKLPFMFDKERFFSSVLRVGSANIRLWTHYDVMDNFLVQVTGRKKVVLFPPQDALYLYLNGDKSEVLDIESPDLTRYPLFQYATQYHCELDPGDILFIPALWFHNVVSLDFSVAVNVFWRHLDTQFYDSKDTYGNRDPPQVQRAWQIMDRALKALHELPEEYRDFYARCMMNKIQQSCFTKL